MRFLRLLLFLAPLTLAAQNAKIDSLKRVIETTKVDTVKGKSLGMLCRQLSRIGQVAEAVETGLRGVKLNQLYRFPKGESNCHLCLGIIYASQNDNERSIVHFQQSVKLMEQAGDAGGVADGLHNLGIIYRSRGDYPLALDCFNRSLKLEEKQGDATGIATSLQSIALLYQDQGNYVRALDYLNRSLKIMESIASQEDVALILSNIGVVHVLQGDYKQALDFYQRSFDLFEKTDNRHYLVACLNNIGDVYGHMNDYGLALKTFRRCVELQQALGESSEMAQYLNNCAQAYLNLGQTMEARQYAQRALKAAQTADQLVYKQRCSFILSLTDSALGDWKAAFEHHRLYKAYSDSLKNDEQSKELGRLESKYEFEKQAEEEKRKAEEATRIEAERTERRNALQYLSIFAGLIALFGALVFLGRLHVNPRLLDVALFAGLLILFEFLLVLFDPIVDDYSGGVPLYKLFFNTGIAVVVAPLHHLATRKLRRRLVKTQAEALVHASPQAENE